MKALVIGLGSMGRRRVRCLRELGVPAIVGFDTRADRRAGAAQEYGIAVRDTLDSADLGSFDVVVISTPPDQHHLAMGRAIAAGKPCFVEASVLREPLPALAAEADRRGYRFDRSRIDVVPAALAVPLVPVTDGQLAYEWAHLLAKVGARNPHLLGELTLVTSPQPHPLFMVVPGDVEDWEVTSR